MTVNYYVDMNCLLSNENKTNELEGVSKLFTGTVVHAFATTIDTNVVIFAFMLKCRRCNFPVTLCHQPHSQTGSEYG